MKSRAGKSSRLVAVLLTALFLGTGLVAGHAAVLPSASDIGIMPDVATPQPVTATVTFTATATGERETTEYAFFLQTPGSSAWVKMRNFRSNAAWSWNTAGFRPGTYGIAVEARGPGFADATRKVTTFTLEQLPAPFAITVNTSAADATPIGTVAFSAAAAGGTGKYEYAFNLQKSGNSVWDQKQPYSPSPVWSPPRDLLPGAYCVCAYARTRGTAPAKGFDTYKTVAFTVTPDHMVTKITAPPAKTLAATPTSGTPREGSPSYALLQYR